MLQSVQAPDTHRGGPDALLGGGIGVLQPLLANSALPAEQIQYDAVRLTRPLTARIRSMTRSPTNSSSTPRAELLAFALEVRMGGHPQSLTAGFSLF